MSHRWHNAICTLAKLHRVNFKSVGLSDFGRSSDFYNRQIKTLNTIATAQAQVVDVDTKVPVGKIPHFDKLVELFRNPATQPKDRTTLVHGDYKIDNLVFHKTEPRIIGILEYVSVTSSSFPQYSSILTENNPFQLGNVHTRTPTFRSLKSSKPFRLCK